MTAQLVKGVGITEMVVREKDRGFLIYLPRNFFGGLIGSPASGHTTHLSSTNLGRDYNEFRYKVLRN